ncbi:hypothetical protein D7W82_15420 [Corallococcus sp. CA049B]|uniref:hypothetical protein n=1 Tax=Corallococcus sp. CA049B TaxID=2316730 RepID=UPI000EA29606|nr:hypothetical protein [Corallococcus sp. CA049B]RKG86808.1 hypothetical protein D7W82_15420 [Corallococcus sp. CA049B]
MKRAVWVVMLGMSCALLGACGGGSAGGRAAGGEEAGGKDAGGEDVGWSRGSLEVHLSMEEGSCAVAAATVTLRSGDPSRPAYPEVGPLPLNVRDGVIEGRTLSDGIYEGLAWLVEVEGYDSNGVPVYSGNDTVAVYGGGVVSSAYIKVRPLANCL